MEEKEAGRPTRRRRVRRALFALGASAIGLTAVVGFLHTSAGRAMMAGVGMSCPARRVSPEAAEVLRMRGVSALRGTARAPARPALGLTLDLSREIDVRDWAEARGLRCVSREKPSRSLICPDVPSSAFGSRAGGDAIDEVSFAFAPDGRLVGVDSLRRALSAAEAARLFSEIAGGLQATLGSTGERAGETTAAYLDQAPLRTARLRYRYADYLATITATNLSGRVALREQYQSAL